MKGGGGEGLRRSDEVFKVGTMVQARAYDSPIWLPGTVIDVEGGGDAQGILYTVRYNTVSAWRKTETMFGRTGVIEQGTNLFEVQGGEDDATVNPGKRMLEGGGKSAGQLVLVEGTEDEVAAQQERVKVREAKRAREEAERAKQGLGGLEELEEEELEERTQEVLNAEMRQVLSSEENLLKHVYNQLHESQGLELGAPMEKSSIVDIVKHCLETDEHEEEEGGGGLGGFAMMGQQEKISGLKGLVLRSPAIVSVVERNDTRQIFDKLDVQGATDVISREAFTEFFLFLSDWLKFNNI